MKRFFGRVLSIMAAAVILGSSLGLFSPQMTQQADAAGCVSPSILFGRWRWCGYFYNKFQNSGESVRPGGVPGDVNTWEEFVNMVVGDYYSGDAWRITEAVFVVRTMIGYGLPNPPCALGTCKSLSGSDIDEFTKRVRSYASSSQNGSQSSGPNGHIDWFYSDILHCGDYNSYYQPTYQDIAPYIIDGSNHPECNNWGYRYDHIVFYDGAGNVLWKIRRLCMNPIGSIRALSVAPPDYSLTASITPSSNGSPLTSGSYVQAGDPISFEYNVNNSMSGTATGINCQAHANTTTGWRAVPSPETTGPTPSGVNCQSDYGPGNTSLGIETIASSTNDTSVCRSLIVSPSTPSGGESAVEVCVYVSSRPYFRVYGGDISAGNPQSNACATITRAGVVGWSKDLSSYSGAATQYAALALDKIYNVATNLGNASGSATVPSGLAFANTSASGDVYGGDFGSLPCMSDYYGSHTGGTFTGGNITPLGTGTYQATGPITINGNVNPNSRIVLYVNGDVTINGNVQYPGNWNLSSMPLFQLIVSGNVYIDRSVSRMDGIYIAQANSTSGSGTIYTCTNGSTPYDISSSGSFNNPCNDNTLVVNGAFIAKQVRLMRTRGTVKQSSATEASGNSNQAEVFNYTAATWMALPPNAQTQAGYDSITSLPPIL